MNAAKYTIGNGEVTLGGLVRLRDDRGAPAPFLRKRAGDRSRDGLFKRLLSCLSSGYAAVVDASSFEKRHFVAGEHLLAHAKRKRGK